MAAVQQAQAAVEQERDVELAEKLDSEQLGRMCLQHRYLAGALELM